MNKADTLKFVASTGLHKAGGVGADALGSFLWSNVPIIGPIAQAHGLLNASDTTAHEEDKMDQTPAKSFIPGVGVSRLIRRVGNQTRESQGNYGQSKLWGQVGGQLLSHIGYPLLGSLIGRGIANATGKDEDEYAASGAGIGYAANTGVQLLASILAGLTPTRTKEEQQEYADKGNILKDIFVPGVGSYNFWKSVGRARVEQGRRASERNARPVVRDDVGQVTYVAPLQGQANSQADLIAEILKHPEILSALAKTKEE